MSEAEILFTRRKQNRKIRVKTETNKNSKNELIIECVMHLFILFSNDNLFKSND
jgi:phosphomevalonate kinase